MSFLPIFLVRCLESSVTDFGNIFHFRKDRPTALNSNIQIPNSKQSANPNFQNSKQKHSEGSALVLHTFLFWSFVFVWSLVIEIWNFRVSGKWVKYGAFFPNFKLPFLGTELMRRGTNGFIYCASKETAHDCPLIRWGIDRIFNRPGLFGGEI